MPNSSLPIQDRPDSTAELTIEQMLIEARDAKPERRSMLEDEVVARCLDLARRLAGRYRDRGEPWDDLYQVACTGLILAIRRFEPDRGTSFIAFAAPTILGEIRRYFRDHCWAIRPPRRLQESLARVRLAVVDLEQRDSSSPSLQLVADHLGLSKDEVSAAQNAAGNYSLASLEALTDSQRPVRALRVQDETDEIERASDRVFISSLLSHLPERSRRVVYLRFFEGLTQQQIADQIGVSQMQVSRLLSSVLQTLREETLREQDDPEEILTSA